MQTAGEKKARSLPGELKEFLAGRAPHSFLVLLLAITVALTFRGLRRDSPTEDEWAHLVRGISYWQNYDTRIHVQHPPLANALAGLPSAFEQNPDMTQMKSWQEGYAPGLDYIKIDYAHAREQLARGRMMMVLFLAGMVAYIFYFCRSLWGWPTAAAAACLIAFNPSLIGQARYVATDLPVTAMATIATGELVRYLKDWRRIFTFGLACGGLVLAKHSGIVLLLMLVLVGFSAAVFAQGHFRAIQSPWKRLLRWLGHFSIAGVLVLLSINAMYKFDRTGMTVGEILAAPEPQHWVTKSYKNEMLERRTPLPKLPQGLRVPLPYAYFFGLFAVQEQDRGGYPSYFMGQYSRHGHWAYFPVLLVLKDPPALLAALGVGAWIWIAALRRRRAQRAAATEQEPAKAPENATFVPGLSLGSSVFFLMSALFLVFIMRSHLNMGIRHGIPAMPLLSVLGGRAFARAGEVLSESPLIAFRAFTFSGLVSALLTGPAYLNYYNVLALGRGGYINVVGDDWGQDREAFVRFARARDLQPLYYHTQTPTRKLEVDFLGLKYSELNCKTKPKPGSWAAIHAQYVHRFENDNCAKWMRGLEPVYKFHDNIWIYQLPEKTPDKGPEPADKSPEKPPERSPEQ